MRRALPLPTATLTALVAFALAMATPATAQRHEILSERIASLQVTAGDDWLSLPVTTLQGGEPIKVSFDDLTHEYHRYTYRLEHCDADWEVSKELFESDYIEGFAEGLTIDDCQESVNTNQLYTHYSFTIPNSNCRLKMSGNYRLTVYDETEGDQPVLSACFMVSEERMDLGISATANTDRGNNNRWQQLALTLNYGGLKVTTPQEQLRTVVLQNGSWNTAIFNPSPQYVTANGLRWEHSPELIFPGGNEYRKFETLDVNHTTMGLERMGWDGERFHAYVFPDEPRPNYVYDESAKGSFLIRNSDNVENDRASDYLWVHFTLETNPSTNPIYLYGDWTCQRLLPQYRMEYDQRDQRYHAVVLLKQGYYSYTYMEQLPDGTLRYLPSEGNFHETENIYQVLIYYRAPGDRADRLVAYQQFRFRQGEP